jgi:hypothetical protein
MFILLFSTLSTRNDIFRLLLIAILRYDIGFSDALAFLNSRAGRWPGGDVVGFLNLWVGKRLRDHVAISGSWSSRFLWEVSFYVLIWC